MTVNLTIQIAKIMNNILTHCEEKNGIVKICITQFYQGKDHTIEYVLCSGSYNPEFGDLTFHFSVDGRRLPIVNRFFLLCKFAQLVLSF